MRAEDAQGVHEGRGFRQYDVAGIDKHARHQVDPLLRAIGEQDLGRINVRPTHRHAPRNELSQWLVPAHLAVEQRIRAITPGQLGAIAQAINRNDIGRGDATAKEDGIRVALGHLVDPWPDGCRKRLDALRNSRVHACARRPRHSCHPVSRCPCGPAPCLYRRILPLLSLWPVIRASDAEPCPKVTALVSSGRTCKRTPAPPAFSN